MDRHCEHKKCNKILVQRSGERDYHFVRRISCDNKCFNLSRRVEGWDDDKFCLYCGELLIKRDSEQPSHFNKRKFCNKGHATSYRNTVQYEKKQQAIEPVIDFKAAVISRWLTT